MSILLKTSKMKFVILDVYPEKKHRLIKDTAGGYGTGNDFGNTFFKIAKPICRQKYWNASIESMYISSIIRKK